MVIKLDRCGVYLCLEGLLTYPAIKVALFTSEEVGCIGSNAVDIDWFKDCAFIFQSDRKGDSDLIYYSNGVDMMDQDFKDFIKPELDDYGYTFVSGIATDVGALVKRKVGCVCFNISSGYFDAHSLEEKVCLTAVENNMNLVFNIMNKCLKENKRFEYEYKVKTYTAGSSSYNRNYGYGSYVDEYDDDYGWNARYYQKDEKKAKRASYKNSLLTDSELAEIEDFNDPSIWKTIKAL